MDRVRARVRVSVKIRARARVGVSVKVRVSARVGGSLVDKHAKQKNGNKKAARKT